MLSEEAKHHRDAALAEWATGHWYEAHEILEELAECFDDDDPSFAWALALTRTAACLHKLAAGVGVKAVPGKLAQAIGDLRDAPRDWCGIDMDRLKRELEELHRQIVSSPQLPPFPVPRLVAAGTEGG